MNSAKKTLWIGGIAFSALLLAEVIAIFAINSGKFVYTLDDAYIHLSIAENIWHGHYGINSNEFSAPASSILWPFLIAPLAATRYGEYLPFFINVVAAAVTLFVFRNILSMSIPIVSDRSKTLLLSIFLVLLIVATNMVGLIFTGMEHSLQLLAVSVIAWGMISEIETNKASPWLLIAVICAPLIRYECLAVSLAAMIFLYYRRKRKTAILAAILTAIPLICFSGFLIKLGLKPLPTSVLAKDPVTNLEGWGSLKLLFYNFGCAIMVRPECMLLCFALLALLVFVLYSCSDSSKKVMAATAVLAIVLHLGLGQYNWFHRYEIYIWAFSVAILIYLGKNLLARLLNNSTQADSCAVVKMVLLATLGVILTCWPYIHGLIVVPTASNNIFEQHYQLHRFVVDYYRKPIAVHDFGYVSYRNEGYVLDLSGVASLHSLSHKFDKYKPEWMNDYARAHNVELAIIYPTWFEKIPDSWIKVGELHLSRGKITPASDVMAFYALSDSALSECIRILPQFQKTLPPGVVLDVIDGELESNLPRRSF